MKDVLENYNDFRNDSKCNFLTVFGFIWSIIISYLFFILNKVSIPLYRVVYNKVKDGYLLVVLSPIVLIEWIITTCITIVLIIPCLILNALNIVFLIWAILFELPSDFINKNKKCYRFTQESMFSLFYFNIY